MENNKIASEKSEKNDINYSLYSDQPEKLFPIAQEQFNKNNFEEGLDILEQSIILAVKKFGGEDKVEIAQFYNKYADGLLQKLSLPTTDFLNIQEDEEPASKNKEEEPKEKEKKEDEIEKDKDKKEENEEEKVPKNNIEDDQIAYENLNAANLLLKNYLKEYDDKNPKTWNEDVLKYYSLLSDNYALFASLEKINN